MPSVRPWPAWGCAAPGRRPPPERPTASISTPRFINDGPGGPPGSTTAVELPPGAEVHFNINIDVWGPDADVSGFGWGALADPNDVTQPARVDATQRLCSQRGSIAGDVVKLKGRMLFSYVPGDVGGPIVTEANLATGHIRFYASNSATTGFLEGTGVVMRI